MDIDIVPLTTIMEKVELMFQHDIENTDDTGNEFHKFFHRLSSHISLVLLFRPLWFVWSWESYTFVLIWDSNNFVWS